MGRGRTEKLKPEAAIQFRSEHRSASVEGGRASSTLSGERATRKDRQESFAGAKPFQDQMASGGVAGTVRFW